MQRRIGRIARCAWGLLPAAYLATGCTSDAGASDRGDAGGGDDTGGAAAGAAITIKVVPDGVPSAGGAPANADLVAVQDGDGDWTEVTGSDGVYAVTVHADRYGVAVGCSGTGSAFYYQSVAEAAQVAVPGCVRAAATATVDVTGGADPMTDVWIGAAIATTDPAWPASLTVDRGPQDLVVRGYDPNLGDGSARIYRGAALDVEGDQRIAVDWSQAEPIATFPLTVTGTTTDQDVVQARYLAAPGHSFHTTSWAYGATSSYASLPAAMRRPGDVVRVEAGEPVAAGATVLSHSAFQEATTPGPITLALADAIAIAPPVIDTAALSQLAVTLPMPPSAIGYVFATASFTSRTAYGLERHQDLVVRSGWAAGATAVTLHVPDLRNLASWTADMELRRGEVDWTVTVTDQDHAADAPLGDRRGVASALTGTTPDHGPVAIGGAL